MCMMKILSSGGHANNKKSWCLIKFGVIWSLYQSNVSYRNISLSPCEWFYVTVLSSQDFLAWLTYGSMSDNFPFHHFLWSVICVCLPCAESLGVAYDEDWWWWGRWRQSLQPRNGSGRRCFKPFPSPFGSAILESSRRRHPKNIFSLQICSVNSWPAGVKQGTWFGFLRS